MCAKSIDIENPSGPVSLWIVMKSVDGYPAMIVPHPQFYVFISDFSCHGSESTGKIVAAVGSGR